LDFGLLLDSLPKLQNKREIVVDRSLFEDLPALDDYDKKVKKRYGTISKLFQGKRVYPKRRETEKERGKDETLFEVDTFITVCIEERDGMLYVFYRQQIIEIT
jgi:hypothetical protein